MSVLEITKSLADTLTPIIIKDEVREAIGEEHLGLISSLLEDLNAELADPRILSEVKRNVVKSFDDWEERVKSVVDFVRPDNTIMQIEIQSLTASEMREIRKRRNDAEPAAPQPRSRGEGRPDPNDSHYKMEMKSYDEETKKLYELFKFWIVEKGLIIEIPGKNDEEKLENLGKKVAGDIDKIFIEILEISNLTQETVRPFSTR